MPCCAFWATRIGCKLCLQQQQKGDEIPAKDPSLAVRAGERTDVEILHEAEEGRENRKVRGEALPCAEHLQRESQRQSRKRNRQQQVAQDRFLRKERESPSTRISYLHFYSLHFDPPAACDRIQSHL